MKEKRIFMQQDAILDILEDMSRTTKSRLAERGIDDPVMVGIHTGGAWIGEHLRPMLGIEEPLGILDISFYRDDFTRRGIHPQIRPSNIPFNLDDRHVILVDDVIQSGRTIRAAMNELFDFGRPASILLLSLINRSERELPVQPDVIGLQPALAADEHIRLYGPDPLYLEISYSRGARNAQED